MGERDWGGKETDMLTKAKPTGLKKIKKKDKLTETGMWLCSVLSTTTVSFSNLVCFIVHGMYRVLKN